MIKNGRQTSPDLSGVREDHRKRYEAAIEMARKYGLQTVTDIGTGTGYGAWMMARAGLQVTAYEIDPDAVAYGEQHYSHPKLTRHVADLAELEGGGCDLLTGFEIVEHTHAAPAFLARAKASHCILSVPNENVVPFTQTKHWQHVRHYTPEQFKAELEQAGWQVLALGSQSGKVGLGAVVNWNDTTGRTLLAMGKRA
jgi:cyclopropane fatty-acyl-phospholipid synthase-like methyltransferase